MEGTLGTEAGAEGPKALLQHLSPEAFPLELDMRRSTLR